MQRTRAVLVLLALTLLPACGTESATPTQPSARPSLDGGGYMGTGNRTDEDAGTTSAIAPSDSATTRGGTGYMGSGN